ncbi:MAG: hypothetical protein LBG15_06405, partial [Dysgonamonadaceae bacterium]|nr:hypothetical protein [Dysgonamonadaceae bacterium]
MKKSYNLLILLALCVSTISGQTETKRSSQVSQVRDLNNSVIVEKAEKAVFDFKAATIATRENFNLSKISRINAANLEVGYRRPYGSLLRNALVNNEGSLSKYNGPALIVPARKNLPFNAIWASDEAAQLSWSITNSGTGEVVSLSDQTDANGVLTYYIESPIPIGYTAFIPELKATVGSQTATYKYGQEIESGAQFLASPNNITHPEQRYTLTDCDVHLGGGPYSGFNSGESFGSNYSADGSPCIGILSLYAAPLGILSVGSIDVLATNSNGSGKVIPAGKTLSLAIFYMDGDGNIEELPVATATATPDDCTVVGWANFINFKFKEVDEDGFETDVILQIEERPFIVVVSGFDASYDIDFLFSTAAGWEGGAFTMHEDNSIKTMGYSNQPNTPMCDLLIAFDGVFNCFEVENTTNDLIVPNAGGSAANSNGSEVVVFSTFGIDEITPVEWPDWLNVTYDDSDFAYNIIYFHIEGTALPSDVSGRADNVVLDSYGRKLAIRVKQGDADWIDTGISTVQSVESVKAVRQGDNFLLSYPTSATSVSVYNVAGQRMGEYKLDAKGKY